MNLHRVDNRVPDWENIAPAQRAGWQRLAAATHGIVTPGNAVTLAGSALVAAGLVQIYRGNNHRGALLLGIGSMCDIADGKVADVTGTKSPLGEALDAAVDKATLLATIIVLIHKRIMPRSIAAVFTVHNAANAVAAGIAAAQHRELHTSKSGKLAIFMQKISMGMYALGAVARQRHAPRVAAVLDRGATMVGIAGTLGFGVAATKAYYKDALAA